MYDFAHADVFSDFQGHDDAAFRHIPFPILFIPVHVEPVPAHGGRPVPRLGLGPGPERRALSAYPGQGPGSRGVFFSGPKMLIVEPGLGQGGGSQCLRAVRVKGGTRNMNPALNCPLEPSYGLDNLNSRAQEVG